MVLIALVFLSALIIIGVAHARQLYDRNWYIVRVLNTSTGEVFYESYLCSYYHVKVWAEERNRQDSSLVYEVVGPMCNMSHQ